jgi:hypothetical protein
MAGQIVVNHRTADQTPQLQCGVCRGRVHLQDAVVVSREILPSWLSPAERPLMAVAHETCELKKPADSTWTREGPRPLFDLLARGPKSAD